MKVPLDICADVTRFFGGDKEKAQLWFFTPNPLLGNIKPFSMLLIGRSEKLREFIKNQMGEKAGGEARLFGDVV